MRGRGVILALVVIPLLGIPRAEAQSRTGIYRPGLRARPEVLAGRTMRPRRRLGTVVSNRYRGYQTRLDRLRARLAIPRPRYGLLQDPKPSASRVRYLLDQRNLLLSRSPLGRRVSALIGRQDYLPDNSGEERGAGGRRRTNPDLQPKPSPTEDRVPEEFEDRLLSRLEKKAEDRFELGAAYFRSGDLIKARNCFEIVRHIQRDRPRGYAADVLVSYDRGDYNRAILSLWRALERIGTLEDLRIDRFIETFYDGADFAAKERVFKRTVESVNLFVKSSPAAPHMNLLLTYYAWLDGDLGTAIAAAEIAMERTKEPIAQYAERFLRLLIEAREGRRDALLQK
jgi:tetratricopeptide (TPR) repeat protein